MTLGEKIRYYRKMKNLTQKELGILCGFTHANADVRIRQYESDQKVPKADTLHTLASALSVDYSALALSDEDDYANFMQALFAIEDMVLLDVSEKDGRITLTLDGNLHRSPTLAAYMNEWLVKKKEYDNNDTPLSYMTYKTWESSFPATLKEDYQIMINAIDQKFQPMIRKGRKRNKKSLMKSDLERTLNTIIQADVSVQSGTCPVSRGLTALCVTFPYEQLAWEDTANQAFTQFFLHLETLASYGVGIRKQIIRQTKEYFLSCQIALTALTDCHKTIAILNQYHHPGQHFIKETQIPFSFDDFEKNFENYITGNDIDLKKEAECNG